MTNVCVVVLIGCIASTLAAGGEGELPEFYATFEQLGAKELSAAFDVDAAGKKMYREPYGYDLDCIKAEHRSGASNVFLVTGKDLAEAVNATRMMLTGGREAERVKVPHNGKLWAVAYLGVSGSSPAAWKIQGVEMSKGEVTLRVARGQAKTKDLRQYFVIIPLEKAEAGQHVLSLQDAATGKTTLSRTVTVE
jgi:hypothetical protein